MTCSLRARSDGRLDEIPHDGWANRLQGRWGRRWEVWQVRSAPDSHRWCASPLRRHWRLRSAARGASTVELVLIAHGVDADQTVTVLRSRRRPPASLAEFAARVQQTSPRTLGIP